MDKTTNFELNKWAETDRIMMDDFNSDNTKIDAALTELNATAEGHSTVLAEHTAAIPKLGNCQIYTTSYLGNGESGSANRNTLNFPHRPVVVMIFSNYMQFIGNPDCGQAIVTSSSNVHYLNFCSRSGTSFSWYIESNNATMQMNTSGVMYYVVAFLDAAQ